MKRRVAGLVAAAAFSGGLLLAVEAGAFEEGITFQEIEPETPVTTQYESRGVRFGVTPAGNEPVPVVVRAFTDGARAAEVRGCLSGRCSNRTGGAFTDPTSRFGMSIASADSTADPVEVLGLDAAGATIATTPVTAQPARGFVPIPDLVAPPGQQFSGFAIRSTDGTGPPRHILFDDLVFDRPDPTTTTTTTTTTTPPPTETTPPPPSEPLPSSSNIAGPVRATFGEPVRFAAVVEPEATTYEWDLDGDGSFERSTGAARVVEHAFPTAGDVVIRLRATLGDGRTVTAEHGVRIARPPRIGLTINPPNPRPGQKVRLEVQSRTEKGTRFEAFAWRIEGVKPLTTKIRQPARRGKARTSKSTGQQVPSIQLKDAQPTIAPLLVRTFPERGVYPVEVTAMDSTGSTSRVVRIVRVGGPANPQVETLNDRVIDCEELAKTAKTFRCPSLGHNPSEPAIDSHTQFFDATPDARHCRPTNITIDSEKRRALSRVFEKLDLGYPAADQWQTGAMPSVGQQQAVGRSAPFKGARAALRVEEECFSAPTSTVVSWDFGDGTKIAPGATHVVSINSITHNYAEAGTYTVEMVARVFQDAKSGKEGEAFADVEKGKLDPANWVVRNVRFRTEITVIEPYCAGPGRGNPDLKIHGIVVRPVISAGGKPVDGLENCWIPRESLVDDKRTVYQPFSGYEVAFGGLRVAGQKIPDAVIFDPQQATLTAASLADGAKGLGLRATHVSRGEVWSGAELTIPEPKTDDAFGARVAPLVPAGGVKGGLPPVNGIPAVTQTVFVSPDCESSGYVKVWLRMPAPLEGKTPEAIVSDENCPLPPKQGTQRLVRSAHDEEPNPWCGNGVLSIDLSGMNLGFVEVKELIIEFMLEGDPNKVLEEGLPKPKGWCGSVHLFVPAIGTDLLGPYKPPPTIADDATESSTSKACLKYPLSDVENGSKKSHELVDGPSGLQLTPTGGFEFGGIALVKDPGITIGPVELYCLSIAGQKKPFAVSGKLAGRLPVGNPILFINACAIYAEAKVGDQLDFCGNLTPEAEQDVTWFRADADLRLTKKPVDIELAAAYFEIVSSADATRYSVGAAINQELFEILKLDVALEGNFINDKKKKKFLFDFYIGGELCADFPVYGWACGGAAGVVSSIGLGACYYFGGAKYKWGEALPELFLGCDLRNSDLRVRAAAVEPTSFRQADQEANALGCVTKRTAVLQGGPEAGLQIRGVSEAPLTTITGPGGFKIVDDGQPLQGFKTIGQNQNGRQVARVGGRQVVRLRNEALITFQNAPEGTYTIESRSGCIQSVEVGTSVGEPQVRKATDVKSAGRARTLHFDVKVPAGDRMRIVEEGYAISRQLGSISAGPSESLTGVRKKGDIELPDVNGSPGKRTVYGIVERDGVPIQRVKLATYQAPPVLKPGVPEQVSVTRQGEDLGVSWSKAANADEYKVTAHFPDGRVLLVQPGNKRSARISDAGRYAGATVRVVARQDNGLESAPAKRSVPSVKAPAVVFNGL